ncbi:hydroxyethylthiazole kinase [Labrenzia sp. CE80]|uniref:hydroxyethylthiazole kinase n=1 Tax=Labrenzia sp. CE80 TaxID=1788986 RepID=UPI00129B9208|nr:hydroxyethylthiazole kinase [Labrenzia sp. CE80]
MNAKTFSLTTDRIVEALGALRRTTPRIHCITNAVAQSFTANVLLALGAVPSMTIASEEVAGFASSADALLINLGTLDETRRLAIPIALRAAQEAKRPIILDPVFVNRSEIRCAFARNLLQQRPTLLRVNREEMAALFPSREPFEVLAEFGAILAMTGAEDVVGESGRTIRLGNGHPLLARVTATGCAGGAVIAAFLAVEPDPVIAAAVGVSVFNIAGEIAAERANGPGSLEPALLDALYLLDGEEISKRLNIIEQREGARA